MAGGVVGGGPVAAPVTKCVADVVGEDDDDVGGGDAATTALRKRGGVAVGGGGVSGGELGKVEFVADGVGNGGAV